MCKLTDLKVMAGAALDSNTATPHNRWKSITVIGFLLRLSQRFYDAGTRVGFPNPIRKRLLILPPG
jgi:hypothetical protein